MLTLEPDRFAVFNYAYVPWIKPAQKIMQGILPAFGRHQAAAPEAHHREAHRSGYVYIGMDHFARANDELAAGPAAEDAPAQFPGLQHPRRCGHLRLRHVLHLPDRDLYWQNDKELPDYYAHLDQGRLPLAKGYFLTERRSPARIMIMRLMCDFSLDYAHMSRLLGLDFADQFAPNWSP